MDTPEHRCLVTHRGQEQCVINKPKSVVRLFLSRF